MSVDSRSELAVTPILYSFRRCPYAIRARLAIASAELRCELREVLLRDKPSSMLEASAKGTVPVLVLAGRVIDESLDVMRWALSQHDPSRWNEGPKDAADALLSDNDGPFKHHLDRYKYADRHGDVDVLEERERAAVFIDRLESRLAQASHLLGERPNLVDAAIFPFVRQFAGVDKAYWQAARFPNTRRWLEHWCTSPIFIRCMHKSKPWSPGQDPVFFPPAAHSVD